MALIPIVLDFSGVARDSSLSLTLTSSGASWSLGDDGSEASEGFSYNGLALGDPRASCLTSIELTDSVLAIRTSSNAAATSLTLALFIDVQPGLGSVQGHCTLNAGATVSCQLGYGAVGQWRSGPFNAIIRSMPNDVRRVRLIIQRAPGGVPVTIELMTEQSEGDANWCFHPQAADISGLSLRGARGASLPLQTFSMTDRQLVVTPSRQAGKASDIFIEAYLRRALAGLEPGTSAQVCPKKLTRFYLSAICDPSAAVVAQVDVQRAQYLSASYNCFYF